MRLCFVTPDYPTELSQSGSGIGTFTHRLARELHRQGVHIEVISGKSGAEPTAFDDEGVSVYYTRPLGNVHYYASRLPLVRRSTEFIQLVRQQEINAVMNRLLAERSLASNIPTVVETPSSANPSWRYDTVLKRVPYVVTVHGSYLLYKRQIGQRLGPLDYLRESLEIGFMRRAKAVIAPSEFVAGHYRKSLGDVVHCIPCPVSLAEPEGHNDRAARPESDTVTVLFASALSRNKGVDTLADAIPLVLRSASQVRFVIVGHEGDVTADALQASFRRAGVDRVVQVIGYVPQNRIAAYFALCDLFVAPTRAETFGTAIAEAMCAGKPAVASRVGGVPELIEDGVTGLLVTPGDPEALAAGIVRLAHDRKMRVTMGQRAADRIRQNYRMETIAQKRLELYTSALKS